MHIFWTGLYVVIISVVVFFLGRGFLSDDVTLPDNGTTTTQVIELDKAGRIVDEGDTKNEISIDMQNEQNEKVAFTTREIMVTDGTKHTVPLNEIKSGGPPKDGIPSIDNPRFVSPEEASEWLADDEPGVAFSLGNTHRFYPYQILVWHEIVNDTINSRRVLVTYCPLCLTGFVLDPLVKGERVEFGTSGRLWKSNLVMYDRLTDSLWSQVLAEAIVGEMARTKLSVLPSDQTRFGEWKQKYQDGEVLSRDTGTRRFYGSNPYGDYFEPTNFAVSMAGGGDDRLSPDKFVFGIVIGGKAKAYPTELVKQQGEIIDQFQGKPSYFGMKKILM